MNRSSVEFMQRGVSPSYPAVNGQRAARAGTWQRMYETYQNLAESLGLEGSVPEVAQVLDEGGRTHELALEAAFRETGIPLETSRVRVGVSRGHLLEVVIQVPLDVRADEDTLQIAAEAYLEGRLGTRLLDEWVGSVAVDRIARTSGLLMVADQRSSASSHSLSEGGDLICRGIDGIRLELPETLLAVREAHDDWTALEIPPTDSGLQAERRFASTCFPEALKCVLEGLPFRSSRFTRGSERFCWVSWEGARALSERLHIRERVEGQLAKGREAGELLVAGTGFGKTRDYVDLWIEPKCPRLKSTVLDVAAEVGEVEFGFYDTPFSEYPLRLKADSQG